MNSSEHAFIYLFSFLAGGIFSAEIYTTNLITYFTPNVTNFRTRDRLQQHFVFLLRQRKISSSIHINLRYFIYLLVCYLIASVFVFMYESDDQTEI